MIQNNNTPDVAYLGCYAKQYIKSCIDIDSETITNCPSWKYFDRTDVLLFDCSGTRYGFRIKELKAR